jgi:hypothetical protein
VASELHDPVPVHERETEAATIPQSHLNQALIISWVTATNPILFSERAKFL